jgi:hypothetical protein
MIEEIGRTVEIVGARFIVPQDMIWNSAKLFWIARRYRHQQRQHLKIPVGGNITEKIPTASSIWRRST